MLKSFISALIAVLVMAVTLFAQTDSTHQSGKVYDSLTFNTYLMIQGPSNTSNDVTTRFGVLKSKLYLHNKWKIQAQYDFPSNTAVELECAIPFKFLGGTHEMYFGQTFSAIGQITPAPNEWNGKGNLAIWSPYSLCINGAGLNFNFGRLSVYAAVNKTASVSATWYLLQIAWEDKVARTVAVVTPKLPVLGLNVSLTEGFTSFIGTNDGTFSGCYNIDYKGLRVYTALNTTRVNGAVTDEVIPGIRLDVNGHVRLKANYATRAKQSFCEMTLSF